MDTDPEKKVGDVRTSGLGHEGFSVAAQMVALERFAEQRGYAVVGRYVDGGRSLLEAISEAVDEFERDNISKAARRGKRKAAESGFWVGSSVPYGYKKVHVEDGGNHRAKLEVDSPAADVVREIFEMVDGLDDSAIAHALVGRGVPGPAGKEWTRERIRRIRGNEVYTGTIMWGRTSKDGSAPVCVENAFPAIVSREVFDRAQKSS